MEKLYGLFASIILLAVGTGLYFSSLPSWLSGATILTGVGLSLLYERRVIKEASTLPEKAVSTMIPVVTELLIISAVIFNTSYVFEASIYLGVSLLLTDLLSRFDELFDVNRSRLLGRISRVLVLSLGLSFSGVNTFILFYSVAAATLVALYDIGIIVTESWSGI